MATEASYRCASCSAFFSSRSRWCPACGVARDTSVRWCTLCGSAFEDPRGLRCPACGGTDVSRA